MRNACGDVLDTNEVTSRWIRMNECNWKGNRRVDKNRQMGAPPHPTQLTSKANKSWKSSFSIFFYTLGLFLLTSQCHAILKESALFWRSHQVLQCTTMGLYLTGDVVIRKRQLSNLSTSPGVTCLWRHTFSKCWEKITVWKLIMMRLSDKVFKVGRHQTYNLH